MLGAGDRLDRYEILRPIAIDGTTHVWLGRVVRQHDFVKLVTIHPRLPESAEDLDFHRAFLDEARVAAKLEHPNVAQVRGVGQHGDVPYAVFDWVEGESLLKICRAAESRGRLVPHGPLLRVLIDVCRGLHAAHELRGDDGALLGVVHRNVNPSNILMNGSSAKLIDLGIAKARGRLVTETRRSVVNTARQYMAPEQAMGARVDRRADIWALGAVLYRALTGAPPFDTAEELRAFAAGSAADVIPIPANLPAALVTLLQRTLRRDPSERLPDADQMRRALEEALGADEGRSFEELSPSALWMALDGTGDKASVKDVPHEPGEDAGPVLSKGATLGRYMVLEPVGEGGMGVVYSAYDPELDRRIAVKLLGRASRAPREQERLRREGMAMARLSHPNIVNVYDVGTFAQRLFVAMELVEGQTLRAWSQHPRSWRDTVAMYVQAGRGLSAAHAVGIVHRDFKPENVIVGRDGRPRVLDFGLAQHVSEIEPAAQAPKEDPCQASDNTWDRPVSMGPYGEADSLRVMGTPRYMPAEQLLGEEVDERADQFAFCVSLWESLYGRPPFDGQNLLELMESVRTGRPREVPGKQVPGRIRAALERGLRAARDERFPTMVALLSALEHDPVVARRRYMALAGAAIAGAIALFAFEQTKARASADPCAHPERQLAGTWDDEVKLQIRGALLGTGRNYAEDTAQRVEQTLDAYAASWTTMRGQVCAASGQGTQRREVVAARDECLDRRLGQFQALTTLLAEKSDLDVLGRAAQAAAALPPIASCADTESLTARVRPPEDPAVRARVAELAPKVNRAGALFEAGKYKEGRDVAQAALAEMEGVDYAPLRAQALYWLALAKDGAADIEGARVSLRDAAVAAGEARDDVLASAAWSRLLIVISDRLQRLDEAALVQYLGPVVARARDARSRANWLSAQAVMTTRAGNPAQSRAMLAEALDLLVSALGPDHPEVATVLNALGIALYDLAEYDQSAATHARALAVREKALGPHHPNLGGSLNNMGNALQAQGDFPAAQAAFERALAIQEQALGPDHPWLASDLVNLAYVLAATGAFAEALQANERAVSIYQKAFGPESPKVATALLNLGGVYFRKGDIVRAREILERVVAMREKALGRDHLELAMPLSNLAEATTHLGDYADARRDVQRAIGIWEKSLGPENATIGYGLDALGNLETEAGDARSAATHCARALAIREKALRPDNPLLASSLICLGRAQIHLGELDEARSRLERAVEIAEKAGRASQDDLAAALLGLGEQALARNRPDEATPFLERALALHATESEGRTELALAEALYRNKSDRARARTLAETARTHHERTGERPAAERARRWLAEHP